VGLATALRPPLDIPFDHRILELPLALVLLPHDCRIWRPSQWRIARKTRRVYRRVRRVRGLARLGLVGLGRGIEFRTTSTFFLLMGVGIVFEFVFKRLTGWRMGACLAVAEKTVRIFHQSLHLPYLLLAQ
jgi:hypothetical protein